MPRVDSFKALAVYAVPQCSLVMRHSIPCQDHRRDLYVDEPALELAAKRAALPTVRPRQGRGNYFEFGGGGNCPRVKGTPAQNTNSPDLTHYFWEIPKFTSKNKQK